MAAECKEYFQYPDRMYSCDGVLLFEDRLVIPAGLQAKGSRPCSTGPQRQSSGRATPLMWRRSAPAAEPATARPPCSVKYWYQSDQPLTTFQSIAADFFDLAGVHYLVTAARMSGWLDGTREAAGTLGAGAKGLIACLRLLFLDKGVPEVISSGGTEFTAAETGFTSEM